MMVCIYYQNFIMFPAENIEAEKLAPQSQLRLPNENIPLVWAQSLYFLGQMLSEGLIAVGDIDPLGRHLCVGKKRECIGTNCLTSRR